MATCARIFLHIFQHELSHCCEFESQSLTASDGSRNQPEHHCEFHKNLGSGSHPEDTQRGTANP